MLKRFKGRARQCRHCLRPYPPPHDCFCWRRPRLLAGLMQVPQMDVGARSVAARATPGPPACVLALNKTVSGAVSFSGTTDFKAVGCTVHSNSRSSQGISVSGAATVAAGGFCSAGGVSTDDAPDAGAADQLPADFG